MSQELVTTIDLLRHGEPEGGHRYRGAIDDPLSQRGWAQLRAVTDGQRPWDVIISSPLRRCADFARRLAEQLELTLELEPGLREMSFGEWEGRTVAEIMAADPLALERFWRDPINHPPRGGEPLAACAARVIAAWNGLLERHAGRHLLLLGHGGVIRLALHHVLEIPLAHIWRLEAPYASFSRVRVYGEGATATPLLVFHNKGGA